MGKFSPVRNTLKRPVRILAKQQVNQKNIWLHKYIYQWEVIWMTNKYLNYRFIGRINTKQLFHSSKCNAKSISLLLTSNFHWLQLRTDRYLTKCLLLVVTWALQPNAAEPQSKSPIGQALRVSEMTFAYQQILLTYSSKELTFLPRNWEPKDSHESGFKCELDSLIFPLISIFPGISKKLTNYFLIASSLLILPVYMTSPCSFGEVLEKLNI